MIRQIKGNIKRISTRLSSRLLILVCATFLPLNIVMLILSGVIIFDATQEVADSWQRELITTVSNIEEAFEQIDDDMSFFTAQYLLESGFEGSNLQTIVNMVYDLTEIYTDADLPGFLYLEDKQTGKMYMKYDSASRHMAHLETAKVTLRENFPAEINGMWSLTCLNQRYYYCKHYEYSNYRLGIYIDIQDAFSSAHSADSQMQDIFLISDGKIVLERTENGFIPTAHSNWTDEIASRLPQRWVKWEAKKLNLSTAIGIHYLRFIELIPPMCWILILIAALSFSLVFFIWRSLQNQVVKPLKTLQHGLEELEAHNMGFRLKDSEKIKSEELKYVFEAFNRMAEEVSASHEKDIKMYQAELDNLRLQVNPHMLLNSYNMIYSLAQTQNFECIQEYILHLSDYFRYVLREGSRFVSLSREMKFVDSYIAIQKIRFPDAFVCSCDVAEEAKPALIPPLLVENFVENAMKYAIIPGRVTHVSIKAWQEEDHLMVAIEDDGQGIKPEILEHVTRGEVYVDKLGSRHIGIYNCRRRMELFYQNEANIAINSRYGEGTKILLDLPYWLEAQDIKDGGRKHETTDSG